MIRFAVLTICFLLLQMLAPALAAETEKPNRSAALPYYNRANRYLAQGRFADAERDLLEAIRLYPDEPDFHTNLGVAYRKLDRYVDAEKEFKIAIAYNRDDWQNWSNLANAYLKQNMLEKTIATFEETLKHKPPETEVEAIKKDIADIKKVLASQGGAPASTTATAPPQDVGSRTKQSKGAGAEKAKVVGGKVVPPKKEVSVVQQAPLTIPTNTGVGKQVEWGYDQKMAPQ